MLATLAICLDRTPTDPYVDVDGHVADYPMTLLHKSSGPQLCGAEGQLCTELRTKF